MVSCAAAYTKETVMYGYTTQHENSRFQRREKMHTIPEPAEPEYFLTSFPRDAFPTYQWTERPATLPGDAWTTEITSALPKYPRFMKCLTMSEATWSSRSPLTIKFSARAYCSTTFCSCRSSSM